jgi:hypothetical protein
MESRHESSPTSFLRVRMRSKKYLKRAQTPAVEEHSINIQQHTINNMFGTSAEKSAKKAEQNAQKATDYEDQGKFEKAEKYRAKAEGNELPSLKCLPDVIFTN